LRVPASRCCRIGSLRRRAKLSTSTVVITRWAPDDFTRFRDDGREQSPTARHKQIGNGVAAPVAEWDGVQIIGASAS